MTARKSPARRRAAAGTKAQRRTRTRVGRSIARLEGDLPPTLAQFSRRVRRELTRLERQIIRARTRYRGQGTRLLRDASHLLGQLEAEGEARWKRLTARARANALKVLRRLEREIAKTASR